MRTFHLSIVLNFSITVSATPSNLAIAQIVQENVGTQAKFGTLTEQLAEVQQQTTDLGHAQSNSNLAIAQIVQENVETQAKFGTLTEQLAEVQQQTTGLGNVTSNLEDYIHHIKSLLDNEHTKIAKTVDSLRDIGTYTQSIRINCNDAEVYYKRASAYQSIEDKKAAIGDYTEAIRINPSYAQAYHDRGLARAELGDKKGAVKDLRQAAKLFFEAGNIANYQKCKKP